MSSTKRKIPVTDLNRRVRVRREASLDPEDISSSESEPESYNVKHTNQRSDDESSASSDIEEDDNDDENQLNSTSSPDTSASDTSSDKEEAEDEDQEAASISFGALAKAQNSLSRPKSTSKSSTTKNGANADGWTNAESLERRAGKKDDRNFARTSKHAPTEVSSKRAVTRKREIISAPKRQVRDPRFDPLSGSVDEGKLKKAYAFLEGYREDEMKELRLLIKKTKDDSEKERLKSKLLSMESRKKTDDRKKVAEEVLARHKREEKELVKKGKQPFYLKEGEKRKRVLLETYGGLKGGQLDRVIERRRRKVDQKEKRNLPWARRDVVGGA